MSNVSPEMLIKLAAARREYAVNAPESYRAIIEDEASIIEDIANVLDGRVDWDDLVADYAPSWRWKELGSRYGR